jgi:hypothetical protein
MSIRRDVRSMKHPFGEMDFDEKFGCPVGVYFDIIVKL